MIIVSVDGGCAGVKLVKDGVIGATSQQYPLKMASLGVQAIYDLATKGKKPAVSAGLTSSTPASASSPTRPSTGVERSTPPRAPSSAGADRHLLD